MQEKDRFAIILEANGYDVKCLVCVGRRSIVNWMLVRFYEPNVIYCPREMRPVLEGIQCRKLVRLDLHDTVLNEMARFMVEKQDGINTSTEIYWEVAIDSIAKEYIDRSIKPLTRSDHNRSVAIYENWKILRKKRLKEEMHLDIGFEYDATRTMYEINYLLRCNM